MAKKKSMKRKHAGEEEMLSPQHIPSMKRVSAIGAVGRHPCPGESPSRKKKSLSQFVSPSSNSRQRMQAAIAEARENKKLGQECSGDVGVTVPLSSSCAFQRVLALDVEQGVVHEVREDSHSNFPVVPSQVYGAPAEHSPTVMTNAQEHSGVQVHIYLTPPKAQKSQRQEEISVDPLVRARRILEFPHGAPLSEDGGNVLKSSGSEVAASLGYQTIVGELSNSEVRNPEMAATVVSRSRLNKPPQSQVLTVGDVTRQQLLPLTEGLAAKAILESLGVTMQY